MRLGYLVAVLLCLNGCNPSELSDEEACGPSKACPSGFHCDEIAKRCVVTEVPLPDAAPDAAEPDAKIVYDAAEPDATIVYDASPPDAAPPDAVLVPDAAPDAAEPDAMPDAAPPDARWVELEVNVTRLGVPVKNAPIITHDPTGTTIRTEYLTDSTGKATILAEPGSWVTGRWSTGAWQTVMGVQEGDVIIIGKKSLDDNTDVNMAATVEVTDPVAGADEYTVGIRDSRLSGLFDCRRRTDDVLPLSELLVYDKDCLNTNNAIAYAAALSPDGNGLAFATKTFDTRTVTTISFSAANWVAAVTRHLTVKNTSSWMRTVELRTPFASSNIGSGSVSLHVPALFPSYKMVVTTTHDAEGGSFFVESRQTYETILDSDKTVDMALSLMAYDHITAGSKNVRWTTTSGGEPAGQFVKLGSSQNTWEFVCPPEVRSFVTPPMPGTPPAVDSSGYILIEGFRSPSLESYDKYRNGFLNRGPGKEARTSWIERSQGG